MGVSRDGSRVAGTPRPSPGGSTPQEAGSRESGTSGRRGGTRHRATARAATRALARSALASLTPLEPDLLREAHARFQFHHLAGLEGPLVVVLVDEDRPLRRIPAAEGDDLFGRDRV